MTQVESNTEDEKSLVEAEVSMKDFLESVHPSVHKKVNIILEADRRYTGNRNWKIIWPDIKLYCSICEGERNFRSNQFCGISLEDKKVNTHPRFVCGDCEQQEKIYSLHLVLGQERSITAYKFGEVPAFGVPVPNRLLRLFGSQDAKLFLKGRQCENLGYGIGAFAYYRRVVENHKNDLFDQIIKVCETLRTDQDLIADLNAAKAEISFAKSMQRIKSALPQGLLINGHSPLEALHGALSVGLHDESDEACLGAAQAVRLVLGDLVERIASLKQDNKQLNDAVQLLLSKKLS